MPWGPAVCLLEGAKCSLGLKKGIVLPLLALPNSALGSAPGLTVLALLSSGERGIHPRALEIGCEHHSPCSASHPAVIFRL